MNCKGITLEQLVIGFVASKGEPNVTFGNNAKDHFAANIGLSMLNKIAGK